MTTARITRKYAEWMEDAIKVEWPDGFEVSDYDLDENFDALYGAAFESKDDGRPREIFIDTTPGIRTAVKVTLEWEDEHRIGLDFPEEERKIEREESA